MANDGVAVAVEVDARGMRCPMPLLKAKKALNAMTTGEVLVVHATDPGSVRDFEVFCRQSGHVLLQCVQDGDTWHHTVRRA